MILSARSNSWSHAINPITLKSSPSFASAFCTKSLKAVQRIRKTSMASHIEWRGLILGEDDCKAPHCREESAG